MNKRVVVASAALLPVVFVAGIWTGLSGAGQDAARATTTGLTAQLAAAQEIPTPKGVRAAAKGTFTATVVRSGAGGKLSWRLTFVSLTGKATASHIHVGARGRAGAVRVALCGPCRTGARGSATVDAKTLNALLAGTTYVNVHTARNAAGEIRGQITKTKKPPVLPPTPTTTQQTTTGTTTDDPYPYP